MISIIPITNLPEFCAGDDLPAILAERLGEGELRLEAGDILVVTQKIVSKSEGRMVDLANVKVSAKALALAQRVGKEPALVELVLRESTDIIREAPGILIARHKLGHVMANAGIDASNLGAGGTSRLLLLPAAPDASAQRIADACEGRHGVRPGVVVSDSFGRPWRIGTTNVAIGTAGPPGVIDQRGQADRDGRIMQVAQIGFADAVAGAAGLAMGEGSEGLPACIVRGLKWDVSEQSSRDILRPSEQDLFR